MGKPFVRERRAGSEPAHEQKKPEALLPPAGIYC
jgi:hypothetical protein